MRLSGCALIFLPRVARRCGRTVRRGGFLVVEAALLVAAFCSTPVGSCTLAALSSVASARLPANSPFASLSAELRSVHSLPRAFIVEPALASAPLCHPRPLPVARALRAPDVDGRGWCGGSLPRPSVVASTHFAFTSLRAFSAASSVGLLVAHSRSEVGNSLGRCDASIALISLLPVVTVPLPLTMLGTGATWLWAIRRTSPGPFGPPLIHGGWACLFLAFATASCAPPRNTRRPTPSSGCRHGSVSVFGKACTTHRVATPLPCNRPTRCHVALTLSAYYARFPAPCHKAVGVSLAGKYYSDAPFADLGRVSPLADAVGRLGNSADSHAHVSVSAEADLFPRLLNAHVAPAPGVLSLAVLRDHRASPIFGTCVPLFILGIDSQSPCLNPAFVHFVKVPSVAEHIELALAFLDALCPILDHGASTLCPFSSASVPAGPRSRTRSVALVLDNYSSARFNSGPQGVRSFTGRGVPADPDLRAGVKSSLTSYGPPFVLTARCLILFPPWVEPPRNSRKGLPPTAIRFSTGLREFVTSSKASPSAAGAVEEGRASFRGADTVPHR